MGRKKEYKQTTEKHPTDNLVVARKTVPFNLGGGTTINIETGDHAKISDPYFSNQTQQRQVLYAPTGNHSKFAVPVDTINKIYKRASGGEETNVDLRDERGSKPNVQTGGRRSSKEIASVGKRKKAGESKTPQSEQQPMKLAAGDQYDLETMEAIVEQVMQFNEQQLEEFFNSLDDQEIEMFESFVVQLQELKAGTRRDRDVAANIRAGLQFAKHGMELTPEQERAVRAAQEENPEMASRLHGKHAALEDPERYGSDPKLAVRLMKASDKHREEEHLKRGDVEGSAERQGRFAAQGSEAPTQKSSDDESAVVAQGVERGVTKPEPEGKGKKSKGGSSKTGFGALTKALQGTKFTVAKGTAKKLKTIGASYEPTEPSIVESYTDLARNQDAINFADTVRNNLDVFANQAIESIKNGMLGETEVATNDDDIVEALAQCDEQQIEQLLESLSEQQIEYIDSLMEAKYGTKKGRKKLAKKIRAGKDIGKKGKHFEEIAKKAGERYGSEERGRAVAAAAMWKRYGGKK